MIIKVYFLIVHNLCVCHIENSPGVIPSLNLADIFDHDIITIHYFFTATPVISTNLLYTHTYIHTYTLLILWRSSVY